MFLSIILINSNTSWYLSFIESKNLLYVVNFFIYFTIFKNILKISRLIVFFFIYKGVYIIINRKKNYLQDITKTKQVIYLILKHTIEISLFTSIRGWDRISKFKIESVPSLFDAYWTVFVLGPSFSIISKLFFKLICVFLSFSY